MTYSTSPAFWLVTFCNMEGDAISQEVLEAPSALEVYSLAWGLLPPPL